MRSEFIRGAFGVTAQFRSLLVYELYEESDESDA